jgi:hypothetical protein
LKPYKYPWKIKAEGNNEERKKRVEDRIKEFQV